MELFDFPQTIPGQMAMDTDTAQLYGIRWGTMRPSARFHLAPASDADTLCGYDETLCRSILAPEHIPWAISEGMVCKRCLKRAR